MTKNRRILISFGIIAVLLLYLLLSDSDKKPANIPEISGWDDVDEILITNKDSSIKLYNKDDAWFVQDFPADNLKARKLEDGMKDLEITDYISNEYHVKYDLVPDKAIHVIVKKDGEILRDVMIGKTSPTQRSAYIKFADSDRIYLASGDLRNEYDTDVDSLRDKKIFKADSNDITWIQTSYKGRVLTFEKKTEKIEKAGEAAETAKADDKAAEKEGMKEGTKETREVWFCKEYSNVAIDQDKVIGMIDSFSATNAESFPDMDKKDVKGLVCLVKAKVNNKEVSLKIHKKADKENYICTSSESPYVFVLNDWYVKKYFRTLQDFKKTEK